jgi:hypothetical protein
MLLRVSGEMSDRTYDLSALTAAGAGDSGVPHGELLIGFVDAVLGADESCLDRIRGEVLGELGSDGLVDAAAVVATFEMVDRIADATGIPLDGMLDAMTVEMRSEIGLDRFGSAANTPKPGELKRVLSKMLMPLAPAGMKMMMGLETRVSSARMWLKGRKH